MAHSFAHHSSAHKAMSSITTPDATSQTRSRSPSDRIASMELTPLPSLQSTTQPQSTETVHSTANTDPYETNMPILTEIYDDYARDEDASGVSKAGATAAGKGAQPIKVVCDETALTKQDSSSLMKSSKADSGAMSATGNEDDFVLVQFLPPSQSTKQRKSRKVSSRMRFFQSLLKGSSGGQDSVGSERTAEQTDSLERKWVRFFSRSAPKDLEANRADKAHDLYEEEGYEEDDDQQQASKRYTTDEQIQVYKEWQWRQQLKGRLTMNPRAQDSQWVQARSKSGADTANDSPESKQSRYRDAKGRGRNLYPSPPDGYTTDSNANGANTQRESECTHLYENQIEAQNKLEHLWAKTKTFVWGNDIAEGQIAGDSEEARDIWKDLVVAMFHHGKDTSPGENLRTALLSFAYHPRAKLLNGKDTTQTSRYLSRLAMKEHQRGNLERAQMLYIWLAATEPNWSLPLIGLRLLYIERPSLGPSPRLCPLPDDLLHRLAALSFESHKESYGILFNLIGFDSAGHWSSCRHHVSNQKQMNARGDSGEEDFECDCWSGKRIRHSGDSVARCFVAISRYWGWGVSRDPKRAVIWLRKAAEDGLPAAQASLGVLYLTDLSREYPIQTAVSWLRKAANAGHVAAMTNVGVAYLMGFCDGDAVFDDDENDTAESQGQSGLKPNEEEAVNAFRSAALLGEEKAWEYLGFCAMNGQGMQRDPEYAVVCMKEALRRGSAQAARFLMQHTQYTDV